MIRPTLIWILLAFCLSSFSLAIAQTAPLCPEIPGGDQLTVEGVGVVQAESLDSENGTTKFINGCFERSGWALEAPILSLDEATNTLSAQNAKIRATGAKGTVKNVVAKEENVSLETLVLTIDSAFKKSGLPAGTYNIKAGRGVLQGDDLTLEQAVFDKIGSGGQLLQRYTTGSALLKNDTLIVTGLKNAATNILVNATDATVQNGTTTAQTVTGSLGRVSNNSDVTFSAKQAISSSNDVIVLQNADIKIFGVPIHFDSYTYDPEVPLEIPLVLGFGDGLTIGLSDLRILKREEGKLTVIGNNLFSSNTATKTTLTLFFRGVSDGWSYFVGQDIITATYADFRGYLERDPFTGITFVANVNSGWRVDSVPNTLRASSDARVGYALGTNLNTDFGNLTFRAKLELGFAWQEPNAVAADPLKAFQLAPLIRLSPTATWNKSIDNFSFAANAGLNITLYPFNYPPETLNSEVVVVANSSFNASYAVKINAQNWGSISSGISWLDTTGKNLIARYAVTPITQLSFGITFTPPIGTVPALGFQGVNFINPRLGVNFLLDLRLVAANSPQPFINQAVQASFDLDFYDGIVLNDNFDRPFQTPNFSLTPQISYDFVTQYGEFGSSITLYSSSFGYVFGAYLTQQNLTTAIRSPVTGFRFSFSLKLR